MSAAPNEGATDIPFYAGFSCSNRRCLFILALALIAVAVEEGGNAVFTGPLGAVTLLYCGTYVQVCDPPMKA